MWPYTSKDEAHAEVQDLQTTTVLAVFELCLVQSSMVLHRYAPLALSADDEPRSQQWGKSLPISKGVSMQVEEV